MWQHGMGLCVFKSSLCSCILFVILTFFCLWHMSEGCRKEGHLAVLWLSVGRASVPPFLIYTSVNISRAPTNYVHRMLLGLGLTRMTQTQVLPWSCSEFRTSSSDHVYLQFRKLWYWRGRGRGWSGDGSQRKGCLCSFERGVTLLQADEGEGNTRWGNCQGQGLEIEMCGSLQHFRPFSGAETHWKVCRRRKVWENGCTGMRNVY